MKKYHAQVNLQSKYLDCGLIRSRGLCPIHDSGSMATSRHEGKHVTEAVDKSCILICKQEAKGARLCLPWAFENLKPILSNKFQQGHKTFKKVTTSTNAS